MNNATNTMKKKMMDSTYLKVKMKWMTWRWMVKEKKRERSNRI